MRRRIQRAAAIISVALLCGCASRQQQPAWNAVDEARKAFSAGNTTDALNYASRDLTAFQAKDRERAATFLREPAVNASIPDWLRKKLADATTPYDFSQLLDRITALENSQVLPAEDGKLIRSSVATDAIAALRRDPDKFSFADLKNLGVNTASLESELFDYDFNKCKEGRRRCDEIFYIVRLEGVVSPLGQRLRARIKDLNFTAKELRADPLHDLFPVESEQLAKSLPPTERQLTPAEQKIIGDAVTRDFKDPFTAQFRWPAVAVALTSSSNFYCGMVNGKNSYGAYVGFVPFMVMLVGKERVVSAVLIGDVSSAATSVSARRSVCLQHDLDPNG